MSVLKCHNVSYTYDKRKNILEQVNWQFESGKVYAVLGPSGSGKTTLLSLLGGLDSPAQGMILLDGTDIAVTGLEDYRRKYVSLIFQSYNLIDYMTPIENARLTAKVDVVPILKRLGLSEKEMGRTVLKLSGGQQQRAAIARSLASDAPVILADEPTGNLDETTAAEITEILMESAHGMGKCVIIVTHSNEVARNADVVLEIKHGCLRERSSNHFNSNYFRRP
ncbi:ATP-binding cassette domain-containing protein [Blautia schinkii]|nr:ATP-binding cassette domain-containing protein [Blautia schinkii]